MFDGSIPWSGLNDGAIIMKVIVKKKHPPRPRELAKNGFHDIWWKLMVQCWAHKPLDRPTVHDLMGSLHATGDPLLPTRNWDNPVLGPLCDPLVHGELAVPSGLPPFLDIRGEGTTTSMTNIYPLEFDPLASLNTSFSSAPTLTAGTDTFSDRKNESSKCCDMSFELLKVETSPEKQVERRADLRTLLREEKELEERNVKRVSCGQNKGNRFSFVEKQLFFPCEMSAEKDKFFIEFSLSRFCSIQR